MSQAHGTEPFGVGGVCKQLGFEMLTERKREKGDEVALRAAAGGGAASLRRLGLKESPLGESRLLE